MTAVDNKTMNEAISATTQLPDLIRDYFEAEASTDPLAPMHGAPFITKGTMFLQLEGRAGAGREEEATPSGLRPWLESQGHVLGTAPKRVLQDALAELGFVRKPFAYQHPERGGTSASYYRREVANFSSAVVAEPRVITSTLSHRHGDVVPANYFEPLPPLVPQRPSGTPEDEARLHELWLAYQAAMIALQRCTLGKPTIANNPVEPKKPGSHASEKARELYEKEHAAWELRVAYLDRQREERAGIRAGAKQAMEEARDEWRAHRVAMHKHNETKRIGEAA